ncbi:MAG: type 4a pilus biogenesis protein PilO [Terriglobales bacterium]
MPKGAQIAGIVVIAVILSAALYFALYKRMSDENRLNRQKLQAKLAEVQDLRKYENNLPELNRQIEILKQQLDIQQRIVPDVKEADQFMHVLQNTAQASGIEIRKWTAKPVTTREFYSEVPFDLELDGPYYAVLTFFDRVAKLERIINVSNLQLTGLKTGTGQTKGKYQYAPQETVTGTCVATTFFSRETPPPAAPAPPAKGKK